MSVIGIFRQLPTDGALPSAGRGIVEGTPRLEFNSRKKKGADLSRTLPYWGLFYGSGTVSDDSMFVHCAVGDPAMFAVPVISSGSGWQQRQHLRHFVPHTAKSSASFRLPD